MGEGTQDEHFDAVIVGSGFGGSVTAYRLAEAGLDVCLLERGKAVSAGQLSATARARCAKNFWDPSEGYYGLFDLWSFTGHRGGGLERPWRRLADLRQRAAAQGRAAGS